MPHRQPRTPLQIPALEDSHAAQKRFDRFFIAVLVLLCLPIGLNLRDWHPSIALVSVGLWGVFFAAWRLGRGGARRREVATHVILAAAVVGQSLTAHKVIQAAGVVRDAFHFLVLVPLIAGYLISARAALAWAGLCAAAVVGFLWWDAPYFASPSESTFRFNDIVLTLLVGVFAFFNRSAIQSYLTQNEAHQARLEELNETLEQKVVERTLAWEEQNGRLKVALEEAQVAVRARASFLAQMSHELRTPLNGVLGGVEIWRQGRAEEGAETVERASQQIVERVETILEAVEATTGEIALLELCFSPSRALERALAQGRAAAEAKGLRWSLAAGALPPTVRGDAPQWQRIVQRVVDNAVKFTERGAVGVEAAWEGGALTVRVTDTGCGFDAARYLQSRFLGDASATRATGGLGFSLSLAIQAAERMGGRLEIRSQPGEGACVTIVAPLQRVEGPAARLGGAGPGEGVLIAEDNPLNRKVLVSMVRRLGWEVEAVEDGQQAVARVLAEPGRWAGVLMDCQMPVMDGYAAACALRAAGFERPIVAVTANALARDREAALAAGMDDWLPKPLAAPRLAAVLTSWRAALSSCA